MTETRPMYSVVDGTEFAPESMSGARCSGSERRSITLWSKLAVTSFDASRYRRAAELIERVTMIRVLRTLLWALVFPTVASAPAFGQQTASVPVDALRAGGHAVLFRHTTTGVGFDLLPLDLANCASQRPLSAQGREEARVIGRAFAALRIPVGRVLASPYCRTLETAQLAFGRVEAWDALIHPGYVPITGVAPPPPTEQRVEAIRKVLRAPDTGTNTILVTHGTVISAVASIDVAEGEMAIYRSDGSGASHLVARILPAQWAAAAGSP